MHQNKDIEIYICIDKDIEIDICMDKDICIGKDIQTCIRTKTLRYTYA